MDHEIDAVRKHFGGGREDGVDRGRIGDVAMADDLGVQLLSPALDPLLERVALIRESEFGPLLRGAAGAMPQAIERLLATPSTSPLLPASNPPAF